MVTTAVTRPRATAGLPKSVDLFTLPPTRTYRSRGCLWVPEALDPVARDGHLTISLEHRRGRRHEQDVYAVGVTASDPFGVTFTLRNVAAPTDPADELRDVTLRHDGRHSCSCTAGNCKLACKHMAAVLGLIGVGRLDEMPPAGPAPFPLEIAPPAPKAKPGRVVERLEPEPADDWAAEPFRWGDDFDRPGEFAEAGYEPLMAGS